jgi:hypothetical protein
MDFGKGGLGGLAQNLVIEVQKYLKGANYPSNKSNLIQKARDNGAPEPVVKVLEKIQDRVYDKPTDVEREVGKFE